MENLQTPSIDEWSLIYTPQNPTLDKLINETCTLLELTGCFGVDNTTELEQAFVSRNLLAGVEFHNAEVSAADNNNNNHY